MVLYHEPITYIVFNAMQSKCTRIVHRFFEPNRICLGKNDKFISLEYICCLLS